MVDFFQKKLWLGLLLLWLLQPASAVAKDERNTGTIKGVVTYVGDVPKSKVRDNAGQQRKLLIVHRRSRGLRYALAYIEHKEHQDSDVKREGTSVTNVVDQIEGTFQPHLIAVRDGQEVRFTNSDAANHNVHAMAIEPENQFNVFTGVGAEYVHKFVAKSRLRPISLSCDLHPWMRGWIYVFKHPYFAVSDEQGKFRIRSVPNGKHQLVILQPDVGYRKTSTIEVKPQQTTSVEIEITPAHLKLR